MKSKSILIFVLLLFSNLFVDTLIAKETHFTWDGNWSEEFNWDNGLPEEGDDVVIDADCTVDWLANIPSLNSLTINAMLDDSSDSEEDFFVSENVEINDGGSFICLGDLNISWGSLYINSGATARFYGEVDVEYDLSLGDSDADDESSIALFYDEVFVSGKMLIYDTEEDPCTAEFHGKVIVLDPFISDDGATVTFYDSVKVSDDFKVYGGSVTVKKYLSCSDMTIGGTFNMEGNVECYSVYMEGGVFDVKGDFTCTVTSNGSATNISNGTFQPTQGTFIFKKGDNNLSVSETGANWFYNVQISGNSTFGSSTSIGTIRIKGNLTIDSGVELITYNNITRVGGDFVCNGTYYLGPYTPTFVFDGGGTQNLVGNVDFYNLTIESGSTLQTGNYVPTVSPSSLTESGYLEGHIKCTENISDNYTHSFGNLGCQITNGSALGSTSVTRTTGSAYSGTTQSLTRWYGLETSAAGSNVTIRLYYRDSELNGNNENELNIWLKTSEGWTKYEPTSRDTSDNYVETVADIPSGVSDWILSDATDESALPVELVNFTASVEGNSVILNWRTETETNNYGFEIERKMSDSEQSGWKEIGFVKGAGNSNSPKSYSFTDNVSASGKYSYRLKQIDLDGSYEYSQTVEVEINVPLKFELSQNYPNPFNPTTTIMYSIPSKNGVETQHAVSLQVFHSLGQKVATLVNKAQAAGNYTVQFDASDLPSGIYFYTLRAGEFVATKKMILMK